MKSVTLKEAQKWVQYESTLADKMDAAIWIRKNSIGEFWVVEVISSLRHSVKPEKPIHFNPGLTFKHSTHIIAMNKKDIKDAIRRNPIFAYDISQGDILYGIDIGIQLKMLANKTKARDDLMRDEGLI